MLSASETEHVAEIPDDPLRRGKIPMNAGSLLALIDVIQVPLAGEPDEGAGELASIDDG